MARPKKTGLDYFPRDVYYWDDYKIMDLVNEYGPVGAMVYDVIISRVYAQGYYLEIPFDKLASVIIRTIGSKWIEGKETVLKIIEFCGEVGLFDKELLKCGIITSVGIQRRYAEIKKRSSADTSRYNLLSETEKTDEGVFAAETEVIAAETPIKSTKIPQSKVKESKVNKSKVKESKVCADENKSTENDFTTHTPDMKIIYDNCFEETDTMPSFEDFYTSECEAQTGNTSVTQIIVPCKNGNIPIDEKYYSELKMDFPQMDIDRSLAKMISYLNANPQKKRKKDSTKAYIHLWLSQDYNDGKYHISGYPPTYDISLYESSCVI